MHTHRAAVLASIALLVAAPPPCWAVNVTPGELAHARQWSVAHFGDGDKTPSAEPPFSFICAGKPSAECIKSWKTERRSTILDDAKTERTITYTDAATGLVLTCRTVEYRDFPVIEWVLTFKNTGPADTPILESIQALDTSFIRPGNGEFTLHSIKGDTCAADSYQPYAETMGPGFTKRMAPGGGRPTNGQFPFWNVATPGGGFMVAVGWPGQWLAQFDRQGQTALRIRAGQELTHFKLQPGEQLRSPLVVLQFYEGDWMRGQNLWRNWMVAHNIPRPDGKLVPTHYGACWSVDLHPDAASELAVLNGYIREKIDLDFYFIDAGWYPGKGNWFETTGTWEVDKTRFPKGIREVSDHARTNGMQFVLWFEPERAWAGTWLVENHPDWVLGGKGGGLVNLGRPETWKWVLERIDSLIVSQGVDVYRQDFNIDPLGFWRGNDSEDRQGVTEIKHVVGYLAFWDELLRRHPKLWLDSCASGGRRNDLETLRRSVPLLRSDAFGDTITQQCQTYGLSLWIPYHGSGQGTSDPYWFRSCIFPASRVGWDTRKTDLDYALLHKMIAEFRKVEPYLLADFYPLTAYSLEKTAWIAWQFDKPDSGGGVVQAFRREACPEPSTTLKLRGLDPQGRYLLTNFDGGEPQQMPGKDLLETGLKVTASAQPAALIYSYQRQP
ncbi:MAG TPA: alpha-galactosidase [Phycisphaerae bacterium]|nr:alpha-galactosidase [Phycisphaerae bacterium]HRY66615.1 alpha-galactosidase [Phycisphaerae bacterium]